MFGREWQVSRVSPLQLNQLDEDLRFHSALRRAHNTFAQRQIEVTANIFDWYDSCIRRGYLREEVRVLDFFFSCSPSHFVQLFSLIA